ncbi:MAG: stage III sporulation protein AA [Oscillospiraceae bacterium]|nr:stage III sporulation protein AA [Oscillospiraceae bacterium]
MGEILAGREDIEYVLDRVTEFSRYTVEETIRLGYLTAEGGIRVGICGTVLPSGNQSDGMREISSLVLRIPKMCRGIADACLPQLLDTEGKLLNTLILSPPGGGKTTLLRDLVRLISDGTERSQPMRVSLVDERGEIAAMYRGYPQLPVGKHTDVMDACPKAIAVPMLLRAMTPQVIAVDEIGQPSDLDALCAAANCGVVLLATIHASSVQDIRSKPNLKMMFECGLWMRTVIVRGYGDRRSYQVEVLE